MARTRWAAILAATLGIMLGGGCRSGSRDGHVPKLDAERLSRTVDGGTIEPATESKLIARPDPFVPYLQYVTWPEPPPGKGMIDAFPGVVVGRVPVPVGDSHWRRASGIRWNGAAAAIYERDGEPLVVSVGDVVGPPGEEETVSAIGRDWLVVRDRDGVQRRILLDRRPRAGWRGMIED